MNNSVIGLDIAKTSSTWIQFYLESDKVSKNALRPKLIPDFC